MGTSDEENRQGSRQRRRTQSTGERGQTTLDFAIGISIFLAVLIFIFLFIPGVLSPFTESTQEETVASNRIADQLAKDTLASPSEPYVLSENRTIGWFKTPSGDDPLDSDLGLDENRDNLNVTIRGNVTETVDGENILCWDNSTGINEMGSGACDVKLKRGDSPPSSSQASVTSLRVVSLNRAAVRLEVVMW